MTKIIIPLLFGLLFPLIGNCQISDSVLIKGQIISKDNYPIPGASINIRGLNSGTVSDLCGKFDIWVPSERVIELSVISEPYYISICDIDPKSDTIVVIFRFDFKQKNELCRDKLLKGKKVKLNEKNRDKYIQTLIACFKADFKKLTWKYYQYYRENKADILFVINGHVMDDDFSPDKLVFTDFEQVFILDNHRSNNPNILFVISRIDKERKERP